MLNSSFTKGEDINHDGNVDTSETDALDIDTDDDGVPDSYIVNGIQYEGWEDSDSDSTLSSSSKSIFPEPLPIPLGFFLWRLSAITADLSGRFDRRDDKLEPQIDQVYVGNGYGDLSGHYGSLVQDSV